MQFQRCRSRNGERSVSAFDCSSAYVQGRADDLVYSERLCAYCRAGNVHNGINCAYLMEVDLLYISVMDFGLCRTQHFKNPDGLLLGRFADGGFTDDLPNFLQAAMMVLVRMAVSMRMFVAVIMPVFVFM